MSEMTIQGVGPRTEAPVLLSSLRSGTPDVSEAVGVTLELHRLLGFELDTDAATASFTDRYSRLAAFGYEGRLQPEVPEVVSFDEIVATADGKRPQGIYETYRYPNLWIPGTEEESYTEEELNAGPEGPVARLVLFNADLTTGVDSSLHFTGLPYDDVYRDGASQTQVEALKEVQEQFAQKHPQAFLRSLGHRAAATAVLMDRIRGVEKVDPKSDKFFLNRGWARVHELGRRTVDGASFVGRAYSVVGRFWLGWSDGRAGSDVGLGLVAGLNELEPQAS